MKARVIFSIVIVLAGGFFIWDKVFTYDQGGVERKYIEVMTVDTYGIIDISNFDSIPLPTLTPTLPTPILEVQLPVVTPTPNPTLSITNTISGDSSGDGGSQSLVTPTPTPQPEAEEPPAQTPTPTPVPSSTPQPEADEPPAQTPDQNPVGPQPSPEASAGMANHIVISEIRAGTTDNGSEDEFVELYNPTDDPVDLIGWLLKKKTSAGNEINLVSSGKFFGTIAPRSFFLIAHQNYSGLTTLDLVYSANSRNLAYKNNSAVLYDADDNVIDEVSWSEIPKDQSIERKAYDTSQCVSAQNDGEYLGNGCDSDDQSDFESRIVPDPQNTQSLSEPR